MSQSRNSVQSLQPNGARGSTTEHGLSLGNPSLLVKEGGHVRDWPIAEGKGFQFQLASKGTAVLPLPCY